MSGTTAVICKYVNDSDQNKVLNYIDVNNNKTYVATSIYNYCQRNALAYFATTWVYSRILQIPTIKMKRISCINSKRCGVRHYPLSKE